MYKKTDGTIHNNNPMQNFSLKLGLLLSIILFFIVVAQGPVAAKGPVLPDKARYNPSVAYDPLNFRYLSVYSYYDLADPTRTFFIRGQFLNPDGSVVAGDAGNEFTIMQGQFSLSAPTAAYDFINKRFLVVASVQGDDTKFRIIGQYVSYGGDNPLVGNTFTIAVSDRQINYPKIAFDSVNKQYLVLWHSESTTVAGVFDVYYQFVDAVQIPAPDVAPPTPIRITDNTTANEFPAVSFDKDQQRYLVVWQNLATQGIKGIFIKPGSTQVAPEDIFQVSEPVSPPTGKQMTPSVAYSGSQKNFLVTWRDAQTTPFKIRGKFVAGTGEVGAGEFDIGDSTINQDVTFIGLTYGTTADTFLATWVDVSDAFQVMVKAVNLGNDGSVIKSEQIKTYTTDFNYYIESIGNVPSPFFLFGYRFMSGVAYNPGCKNFLTAYNVMTSWYTAWTIEYQLLGPECRGHIAVDPKELQFGQVDVGHSSEPLQITLANVGWPDLTVSNIEITGENIDYFSITEGGVTGPLKIEPGKTHTLSVVFTPQDKTTKEVKATLVITSDDPDAPTTEIALTGNSKAPPLPMEKAAGGNCLMGFIASGTYQETHLGVVRSFRDNYLKTTPAGRKMVDFYYTNSPAAIAWLQSHPWSTGVLRVMVVPVYGMAYFFMYSACLLPAVMLTGLLAVLIVKKRRREARQEA